MEEKVGMEKCEKKPALRVCKQVLGWAMYTCAFFSFSLLCLLRVD